MANLITPSNTSSNTKILLLTAIDIAGSYPRQETLTQEVTKDVKDY